MPLYEYYCSECQETFEVLQSMGAGSEGLSCPHCGAEEVEKQFSAFAVSTPVTSGGGGACGGGSGFT